jgi:hypothetical protein
MKKNNKIKTIAKKVMITELQAKMIIETLKIEAETKINK